MIDLQIEATKTSPYVMLNSEEGYVVIRGKSTPESAINFYFPLIEKIKRLFQNQENIKVDVALEYFNTSSSKCLFDLLRTLKKLEGKGAKVVINWFYEDDDEDMLESGEDYEDILQLEFHYVNMDVDEYIMPQTLVA